MGRNPSRCLRFALLTPCDELFEGEGHCSFLGLLAAEFEHLIEKFGVRGKIGSHVRLRVGVYARAAEATRREPRAKLLELVASLPACVIGMEACSGRRH